LDRKQILILAKGICLADTETFVAALEHKENIFMAATPRDLEWLTEYWRRHNSIGMKWDMMAGQRRREAARAQRTHYYKDTLPPDQSRTGTQRLAAANALCASRILSCLTQRC